MKVRPPQAGEPITHKASRLRDRFSGATHLLRLFALSLLSGHEARASAVDQQILVDDDLDLDDLQHGSFIVVTKEQNPRTFIVDNPAMAIVINALGSGPAVVQQVAITPSQVASLLAASQDAAITHLMGQQDPFIQQQQRVEVITDAPIRTTATGAGSLTPGTPPALPATPPAIPPPVLTSPPPTTPADTTPPAPPATTRPVEVILVPAPVAPVFRLAGTDSAAAVLNEANAPLVAAGTLTITDLNVADTVESSVTNLVVSGFTAGAPSEAALRAMLSIAPESGLAADPGDASNLTWTFSSDNQSFDYLATGQSLVLTYTVTSVDPSGAAATQNIVISINGTNDPPVNSVPGPQVVAEDAVLVFSAGNGNAIGFSDVDNASHSVTLTATNGVLTLASLAGLGFTGGSDGIADATMSFSGSGADIATALAGLSFTPDADFNGPATLQIVTSDGTDTDTDSIAITVTAVNDAPVAVDDDYFTNQNSPLTVTGQGVLGNDTDIDSSGLDASLVSDVNHGTLVFNEDGSFVYTPDTGYVGLDSFTYQADDGTDVSNVATVNLQVGNGSFEAALTGWSSVGDVAVVTSSNAGGSSVVPTDGSYMAALSSRSNFGGSGVGEDDLEGFLGIPDGTLDGLGNGNATQGTALKTTIHLEAGQTVQFDYRFDTNDYLPYNDFAFVTVSSSQTTELTDVGTVGDYGDSGWLTFSHTATTSGDYLIGMGVVDVGDQNVSSVLYIDHFYII